MKNKESRSNPRPALSAQSLVPATPSPPLAHPVSGLPPEAHYNAQPFDPVPVQPRHNGWTPERQLGFIEALAATACVEDAARSVGMTAKSAYLLRARADAATFRSAWEAALYFATSTLEAAIYSRAIHGVPVPHYYKGELVGEHRRYNDNLALFLMRQHGIENEEDVQRRARLLFQRISWLTPDDDDDDRGETDAGGGDG